VPRYLQHDELRDEESSLHYSMHRVDYRLIDLQPEEIEKLLPHNVVQQLSDP
jgi:hypothetical protein